MNILSFDHPLFVMASFDIAELDVLFCKFFAYAHVQITFLLSEVILSSSKNPVFGVFYSRSPSSVIKSFKSTCRIFDIASNVSKSGWYLFLA